MGISVTGKRRRSSSREFSKQTWATPVTFSRTAVTATNLSRAFGSQEPHGVHSASRSATCQASTPTAFSTTSQVNLVEAPSETFSGLEQAAFSPRALATRLALRRKLRLEDSPHSLWDKFLSEPLRVIFANKEE